MSMVNMKRAEVEKKGGTLLGEPAEATKEDYFYGLRINLEEPELQKLGLDNPKVGSKMPMMVTVKVVSYAEEENGRRAELLITDMGMKSQDEQPARTDVMYPGKES